ncbi:ABC transporter permease [Chengkuizengella axinellae]|uniref:ABC transporter permease n=1 Tax=Chengkuizengella axinellae TaxID=3064388 RepID=A0ABT9J684_9BACL|nr:ABC transporter permease [Chengkuizengella sp. 2205SS18-9]MDP5277132.1 ABC transporter permease [Chengkuizengella sp. 2205SS18-9]
MSLKHKDSDPNTLVKKIRLNFTKKQIREKRLVIVIQMIILFFFIGLWEIAGRLRWIDVLLFSYPSKIMNLLYSKLMDGSLLPHIGTTLFETVIGFILGTLCGTLLAILIWSSKILEKILDPFLVVLNSMPKIALGPLFIVGLGAGYLSIIAMTLAITVIITALVVLNSFKEIDSNYIKVVKIFGANKRETFMKVILPASIPTIVSTLKVNVGLAWIGSIVGEFLVSQQGLGYLIIYGFQVFNFTLVMGSLFIIAIFATLMYQAVAYIELKLNK